jgi:hypothetical protein
VTTGTPSNIEGGAGITPGTDSGAETSTGDAAVAAKCEGNKQTGGDIGSAKCQAKLNEVCCAELKTCFDIVLTPDDAGARGTDDCDKYRTCLDTCLKTYPTDQPKLDACDKDCVTLTQDPVVNAYNAIINCAKGPAAAACQ